MRGGISSGCKYIMAMFETILQIQGHLYPFGQAGKNGAVGVEERQVFSQLNQLLEKRREMSRKKKLLDNPCIIKLLNVSQQDLTLHYLYEYVPHPLATLLPRKLHQNPLCGRQLIKRISFDLTVLISYLVDIRIELDLSVGNLGLTEQDKLKVFINARCRMGHKSQINLIAHYRHCKENILAFLECQLANIQSPTPQESANFVIKGNKLVFPKKDLNQSVYSCGVDLPHGEADISVSESGIFASNVYSGAGNLSTASCINPQKQADPCRLRQTQSPRFGRTLNFSESKDRNHKNSFQFGTRKGRGDKFFTEQEDDNADTKSYTHSRSIRIEFEQKFDPNTPKKRKESCKLKITTFHEYQMDDVNTQELFTGKKENLFEQFTRKAEEQEQREFIPKTPSGPFKKHSADPMPSTSTSSSRLHLQQKVRQAKQKAENLLSRFLAKKSNQNLNK